MSQTVVREPEAASAAVVPPVRTPPPDIAATASATRLDHDFSTVGLRAGETASDSWIPDAVLERIRAVVRAIPGYTLVAAAIGQDPLTGRPVTQSVGDAVEALLLAGPFGPGVAAALETMNVLGSAWTIVRTTLAEHRVTVARVASDIGAAWDRLSVTNGLEGNVAIVRGYLAAFLSDIRAAIGALVDRLLAAVRAAVVPLIEPHLTSGPLAPVWNLAVKVLHHNPLTGAEVPATTVEIIGDFLTLIGQPEVLAQMTERGTLQQTADWVDAQIAIFLGLLARARVLFGEAWDAISPANLPRLLDTLPGLADRAVALFGDIRTFATTLIGQVLTFVRDSLLGMLSEHAHRTRGFRLLTVILGRNPFTGAAVERTAENLIGGFVELVAGPETYAKLAEAGVIADAAQRIESEMTRLNITWALITETFRAIWEGLTLADFLDPIGAIARVVTQFGEPLGRIVSFAATVIQVVVELVLRLMNFPSDLLAGIVAGVQQALGDIQADPVGFLMNMLSALKQGFAQFFDHIATHLVQGLADWLFRGLRGLGIEIPSELSGESILKLALDVMGLSMEFLWECLGEVIGAERVAMIRDAIDRLGEAWAFIADVQLRGMVAVWDYIGSQLSNLWTTILTMAKDWLMTNLIQAAIEKVLSMLDPTGIMAVVNSAIAFFRAVESVIEYVTEILQIVKTYVDTLAAIAAGNLGPGATMLENGLAGAIPVAIGFLASQVGLSDVPEKIVEIITGLRQMIKDAVIWLIRQALRLGQAALNALGLGGGEEEPAPDDGSFSVHEEFPSIEEPQHVVSNVSGTFDLTMASGTPHPLSEHPDDQVKQLYAAYLAAITAATSPSGKRAAANQHLPALVARIKLVSGVTIPRASAPGIGDIAMHSAQQSRLQRNGPKVWHLESEHVIPRGFVDAMFTGTGLPGVTRGGSEYRAMHTILIYKGAADSKTDGEFGDLSRINWFKNIVIAEKAKADAATDSTAARQTMIDTIEGVFRNLVFESVGGTEHGVSVENAAPTEDVPTLTNAQARGPANGPPEPKTPDNAKIGQAAGQQLDDVLRIWRQRVPQPRALPV